MTSPTYDYETEQADLVRRQKLIDAMMGGALAPIEYQAAPGVRTGKASMFKGLEKIAQAFMANQQQGGVTQDQASLRNRYKADGQQGLEKVLEGMSATAGPVMARGMPDGGAGANNPSAYVGPTTQTPEDVNLIKRKAIIEAMGSNHPMVKDIGVMQMQQLIKAKEGGLTAKDFLGHADAPTLERLGGTVINGFKPKVDLKTIAPGDIPINDSGRVQNPGNASDPMVPPGWKLQSKGNGFSVVTDPSGDVYQMSATGFKKMDNAPKVTVNSKTVVNSGETAFSKKIGEMTADDVAKVRQARNEAQRTLQSMQKLEQLEAGSGVVNGGPLADKSMALGTLAEGLGFPIDKKKLAVSQEYQGEVMSNLSNQLTGSLARSTTDKDMEILKAPLPTLLNSKEGRAALRRQAVAKAQERIQMADQMQSQLKKEFPEMGRLFDVNPAALEVPQRSDVQPGGPKVVNW